MIIWGGKPGPVGTEPPPHKPMTSELGCVTPFIIVPGEWSAADLEDKAKEVVAAVSGFRNAYPTCS